MYLAFGHVLLLLLLLVTPDGNGSIAGINEVREKRNRFVEIEKLANEDKINNENLGFGSRKREALALCRTSSLTKHQRKLCAKFPLEVFAAFRGFQKAVSECQHQFRNERWNCSSLVKMTTNGQPLLTPIMRRGFKEVAFVYSLVAAAVAMSVTVDCSRGFIPSCDSARRQSNKEYSTFIQHGLRFSVKFLSSRKDSNDFQDIVNKHNLKAGRLTFINNLNTLCKCHGVSGSCSLKSCANTAPDLRQVATALKKMYTRAKKVEVANEKRSDVTFRAHNEELIYLEKSPTFCEPNDVLGINGVKGRICSRDRTHENSCDVLCCGRGYDTQRLKVVMQCQCVFKWCCFVECKTCSSEKWTALCK